MNPFTNNPLAGKKLRYLIGAADPIQALKESHEMMARERKGN